MDTQELSVSVVVVLGRNDEVVGKRNHLFWSHNWVLILALLYTSHVTWGGLLPSLSLSLI